MRNWMKSLKIHGELFMNRVLDPSPGHIDFKRLREESEKEDARRRRNICLKRASSADDDDLKNNNRNYYYCRRYTDEADEERRCHCECKSCQSLSYKFIKTVSGEVSSFVSPLNSTRELMESQTRAKIIWTAAFSRLLVLLIQIAARLILDEHQNDGFKIPESNLGANRTYFTLFDKSVDVLFGGFKQWDGQYFLNIALNGYTHENTIAFFPLFPMLVGIPAKILHLFTFLFLSKASLALLIGSILNMYFFVKTTLIFAQLVTCISKAKINSSLVKTAVFLFAFNPASIFFSAFYSETLFAFLTTSCMLALFQKKMGYAIMYASLSSVTRSNGLLNLVLCLLSHVASIITYEGKYEVVRDIHGNTKLFNTTGFMKQLRVNYLKSGVRTVIFIISLLIGAMPFAFFQHYCIDRFCDTIELDQTKTLPPFCTESILPYTHIQGANWNVGFLRYFELKQIPNFILASPVLFILFFSSCDAFYRYFQRIPKEGFRLYENCILLFLAAFGIQLSLFCTFFIHVQVSTRLLFAACPQLTYYLTRFISQESLEFREGKIDFTLKTFLVNTWIGIYFIFGTLAFSLAYPWT